MRKIICIILLLLSYSTIVVPQSADNQKKLDKQLLPDLLKHPEDYTSDERSKIYSSYCYQFMMDKDKFFKVNDTMMEF